MKYGIGTDAPWYSFHSISLYCCCVMLIVHSKFVDVRESIDKEHIFEVLACSQYQCVLLMQPSLHLYYNLS